MSNSTLQSTLAGAMQTQLLRYAVQTQMFCKICGDILDVRRATLATLSNDGNTMDLCGCTACVAPMVERLKANIPTMQVELITTQKDARIAEVV